MQLEIFSKDHSAQWDAFCATAPMATFLHTRRYLSYHGDRFKEQSVIVKDGDDWLGVLPAAASPSDNQAVVSHPGISYGGFIHCGALSGQRMIDAFDLVCEHYSKRQFNSFYYKCIPPIYHQTPSQDDIYALFRMNASRVRCDLSSAIDLGNRGRTSKRRQRSLKKALGTGVTVKTADNNQISGLWSVLSDNLARKHGASAVHTEAEIRQLASYFPGNIQFIVAVLDNRVEAGVALYKTATTHHAQYIASSEIGYKYALLDAVLEHSIAAASADVNTRYFDFGISTENQGTLLNHGLHQFKTEFGSGGIAHEFYQFDL